MESPSLAEAEPVTSTPTTRRAFCLALAGGTIAVVLAPWARAAWAADPPRVGVPQPGVPWFEQPLFLPARSLSGEPRLVASALLQTDAGGTLAATASDARTDLLIDATSARLISAGQEAPLLGLRAGEYVYLVLRRSEALECLLIRQTTWTLDATLTRASARSLDLRLENQGLLDPRSLTAPVSELTLVADSLLHGSPPAEALPGLAGASVTVVLDWASDPRSPHAICVMSRRPDLTGIDP